MRDLIRSVPARAFLAYSVGWTLIDSTTYFIDWTPKKPEVLAGLLFASLAFGFYKSLPKSKITFSISNTDTKVRIHFGDLFKSKGLKIIPVNEFLDSELGDHVSETSLHGIFIKNILGNDSSQFDSLVAQGLPKIVMQQEPSVVTRDSGKTSKYQIGTTVPVDTAEGRYLLNVLTKTDLRTLKAEADVECLWKALCGAWQQARVSANGHSVAIPLIGSGLSGVGLPPQQLLQMIVISIVKETHKAKITSDIEIVIHDNWFDEIDLRAIQRGKF